MLQKVFLFFLKLTALFLISISSAYAASAPTVANFSPAESFIGEGFCFNANFTNSSSDIGYGPYYLLNLAPDLTYQSATFSGLDLELVSSQTYDATETLNDPISGLPFTGTEDGTLVALTIPVGSVSNNQQPLQVEVCLTVALDAEPNILQTDAIGIVPGFQFGDSATGTKGEDTIVGSADSNDFTPTVIKYTISDSTAESENPPGPEWTYPVVAIADIASTRTVAPITFPTITLPGNVKYEGPFSIVGGTDCTISPDEATLAANSGVGNDVDINISCASGTGTNGNSQDIRAEFDVYITDTLNAMTCDSNSAINSAKHLVLRKSVAGSGTPGSTVTYTYAYQTSEYIDGLNNFTVTDILQDGISYSEFASNQIQLSIQHNGSNSATTTLNTNFTDSGTSSTFEDADILAAIVAAGGSIGPAESGTITYTAVIDQDYDNGQPVLTRDTISNDVTATYGLSDASGAQGCFEDSSATVTIDDIDISKNTIGSSTVKPGDIVQFQLTMEIPSGDANNVVLTDVLPLPVFTATDFPAATQTSSTPYPGSASAGNFIEYAGTSDYNGDFTVTRDAGSNSINIDFGNISTGTASSKNIVINVYALASNEPYVDGLSLANLLNASTNNTATDNATNTTVAQITVRAPDVSITKTITSDTSDLDAGDQIDYLITLENTGGADAFDVTLTDIFESTIDASSCTVPVLTGGSGGYSGDFSTGLVLDDTLASGGGLGEAGSGDETATLTFSCNISSDIAAGTSIDNTASMSFAAGEGESAFPTRESTITATSIRASVVKTLVSTSETDSTSSDSRDELAIGEIARFRIVTALPEGLHSTVNLRDLLPPELIYQDDGSAKFGFVGAGVSSSEIADPGTCTYTLADSNASPDCDITATNGSFSAGTDPTFNLGTVTNSDDDADEEYIVLEINAVKVDGGNVNFSNRGRYTDSTGNDTSNSLNLKRVDPTLTLSKDADNAGGDAGDAITYTLTITAPASSDSSAFDLSLVDILPTELIYESGTATYGACDAATKSFDDSDPNGAGFSLTIDKLAANESCIFTYDANVSSAATPGQEITNNATLSWTSLDGSGSNLSGSSPGTEKTYQATNSATVTVELTTSEKSIVSTTFAHTSEAGSGTSSSERSLSIGEEIKYRLVVTVPEGSAENFIVRDNLPEGLEYVNNTAFVSLVSNGGLSSSLGAGLCAGGSQASTDPNVTPNCAITPNLGASGNSVDFDMGDITNSDADSDLEYIVIEFSALVINQLSNQQNVTLSNQFEVLLSNIQNSVSNNMLANILEPQLSLTSTTTPSSVDNRTNETPTFAWSLVLTNEGLAQAFQIQDGDSGNWQVQLPSGVENITALDVSSTGTVVDNTNLSTAISSSDFTVSGADNNLLSINRIFSMSPSATLTITFNTNLQATVKPGTTLTANTDIDYAGQQSGASAENVRNFADITTGTGNTPVTSTSAPLNNYRTQTATSVVTTTSTPVIGVAKELISNTFDPADGTFDIVYRFYVENSGDVALSNIQLTDDLAATFNPIASGDINVTSITSTDFTVDGTFDGISNTTLIDNTTPSDLAINETKTLDIAVTVSPGTDLNTYNNSTTAEAESARDDTNTTNDTSVNGSDPDTANDGPDNDTSPTPVTFAVDPALGLAKSINGAIQNNADGTYTFNYQFNVKNTGDVNLTDLQVIDNLSTTFASADSFSISTPTSADFTVNASFNGVGDTNLLAANQSLAVGDSGTINLEVTVTPGSTLTYNNSATTSANSPNGTANDTSDNGTDPETNNGNAADDDATPVTFAEAPAIGVAKTVSAGPTNNGDGTHTLTYSMVVKNTGDISLSNVQVVDDLTTTFSGATFVVDAQSTGGTLTINNAFNGDGDKNLLAANQNLAVGASETISLTVTVTPGTNLGPYNNSATAGATSPSGATVNDTSDNGTDPETNNGNAADDDATPVTFAEAPAIGVAKTVSAGPTNNGDGTHTLTYSMVVKNTGDISLSNVQVVDDLTTTFSGATFVVDAKSTGGTLTINNAFNGDGDKNLLAANQNLAVGESETISLTVTVTPGTNLGPYNNSATAGATSPSGATVNDTSDNGTDPETNNGNAADDDATPVTFAEAPAIGVAKTISTGPTNNGDGTHTLTYSMVVKNTGDISLSNVQVVDDLTTTFSGATFVVDAKSTGGTLTINNAFNGNSDKNLLAANQNLAVGESETISLTVTVTPGTNLGPYNNSATAGATSPSGATVNDTSDNGTDPETNNGNAADDDATPVTFAEAPAIGVAKTVSAGPTNNGDGTHTLTYSMVVKNTGDISLSNVQVVDDLTTTFSGATFVVDAKSTGGTLTINNAFNGDGDKNLLAANQNLAVGASETISLTVTVTPGTNLGPYNNSATAEATSPSGATVNDTSDNGTNPETNNGNGGLSDSTPVSFVENPAIGVAKSISAGPTNNSDGTYTLTYALVVKNTGAINLSNVQVVDNLNTTFSGATYVVDSKSTVGSLNINNAFNGDTDTNLLAANQNLSVGAQDTISVTVTVTPGSNPTYSNSATGSGDSPSGASVSDISDAGSDPESNNGAGGFDDATTVNFDESPAIGIAKRISSAVVNNNDGSYTLTYSMLVQNNGDIELNSVQIIEDFAVTYPSPATVQVDNVVSNNFTVNPSFNGYSDKNLLSANQTLTSGALASSSATLDLTITIIPGANLGPYNNTAKVNGTSPSGAVISDDSDDGTDANGDNGDGNLATPTPVTFTEAPAIGIAKEISGPVTNNEDGSYSLIYSIVVRNIGDVILSNVQVSEPLSTTFNGASFTLGTISSADLNINNDFDGASDNNLLASAQSLAINTSATILVPVTITPGTNLGPYSNTAVATGESPSGDNVTDNSDNGSDPATNNGDAGNDDATVITFTEAPDIGIAKAMTGVSNLGDGRYQVNYQFNAKNTGDIVLNNVQVTENLANIFADANTFSVLSLSSTQLTVNSGFDGSTDTNLLDLNQTLAASATATIELSVIITPAGDLGPYNNSVSISSTSPSGDNFSDVSDNGTDPESNNGEGGLDDTTPVTFAEAPAIGIAKLLVAEPTNNNDGTYNLSYQLVVENIGDISLSNVQIVEDLRATFPAPATFVVNALSANTLTVNADFDGESDSNILAANQSLAVAAKDTLLLQLTVTPGANLGPYNNTAVASGQSPSGDDVNDNSDNGSNTSGDNGAGTNDDATPVTFTEAPAIGVAKAMTNVTNNGDGSYALTYTFNLKNTGDIALANVQVVDDLMATFQNQNIYTITSLSSASLMVNSAFNGDSDTNLLAANQSLVLGASDIITLVLELTPAGNLGPYNNSALASGVSPSGNSIDDTSDNGIDPEGNNGEGGLDDSTPITFTEAPAIGIAKLLVAEPVNNSDGTYNLSYQLVVENIGDISLSNVQIVEDLRATFPAPATFVVNALSANTLTVNADFDGESDSNILAANQSLAVAAKDTLLLQLTVTPGANLGPYNNTAVASGQSPSGDDVNDNSDNGSNTSGDNGAGTNDDATPVTFTEAPAIGVAKAMTNVTNNGDGSYALTYTFNLKNTGDIALANVQVVDDLMATFQNQNIYTITSLSSASLMVNSAFNGDSDTNLLAANQSLVLGASDIITLVLELTPAGNLGPYNNSALASGVSPSGNSIDDTSDNGIDPEGNNGEGGLDDSTPITFTEAPAIGIAKLLVAEPVNNSDGTYNLSYQLVVENIGDISLSNVQIVEDLRATFPAPATFVVNALSANTLTVNADFDGESDSNILAANQSLAVAAKDTLLLSLTVTPGTNLGPYNNTVVASGQSPSGADVNDDSDNGANTIGDNGDGTDNDPTPVTFTEAPAIGVAKTVSGEIVPTVNGSVGNFDVPFALVIQNNGDVPLTNIQLVDDLSAQFGSAYVSVSEAAEITASTAEETPNLNTDFPANLFDGISGRLMPGQSINISFTLELNPGAEEAKGIITNQAEALGTSTGGVEVNDLSDSGTNASNNPANGGDNPSAPGNSSGGTDDPTPFELPAGSLQGVVWIDADRNDALNEGEPLLINWTVQVTDTNGNIIATILTDENGFFSIENLPQGDYTVDFMTPNGTTFFSTVVYIPANESVNVPVPVDPSGVVYDSITRIPVANSLVSIINDAGTVLPDVCLLPNQQDQITGEDGYYFFLLFLGADPACQHNDIFTLVVTAPEEEYQPSHSNLILPQAGVLDPTGQQNPFALSNSATAPEIGDDTTYYMDFTLAQGDPDVINNHIPVDKIGVNPSMIRLTKSANTKQTLIGGLVRYNIQIENISEVDVENLTLIDYLPAGFTYVENSAYTNDADGEMQITSKQPLTVSGIDVPAESTVEFVYILRVGAGVARGKHINRVSPYLGSAPIGNEATATVIVGADPDFEEVTILGKVFDDRDSDNWQDSANASAVFIQGGINESSYIANSTFIIDADGQRPLADASAPLNHGIDLGDLSGRSSEADKASNHQIIIRQQLKDLAFTDNLTLTTAEGTHLTMSSQGKIVANPVGKMADGLTAQDLRIERNITVLANGNYQVDLVIQNQGIQEIGIPGVRVATVEGLYIETDLHGRFHLEAVDVENLARGRNFYMKVDKATLPPETVFVSENPRVKRITQGLPARFDFAIQLAKQQLGGNEQHALVKLGELLFNENSAEINTEHKAWLTQMSNTINQYQGGTIQITAQAHTQALAYARANNTYQWLLPLIREDLQSSFSVELVEEVNGSFASIVNIATQTQLGKILFESDKSTIKAKYQPLLDSIAKQLVNAESGHLAITGFADNSASEDYNLALGLRRAKAVFEQLKTRMPAEVWEKLTIKIQKLQIENSMTEGK